MDLASFGRYNADVFDSSVQGPRNLDKVFISVYNHSRDEQNPFKISVEVTLQRPSLMCCCHV